MWWAVRPALRTLIAWRPAVETGVARLVPRLRDAQRGGNSMEQMLTVQQRCLTLTDEHAFGPAERPVAFEEIDRVSWMLMVCAQWPENIQPLCVTDRELSLVAAATEVETPERNVHALRMRRLAEMTLPALRPSINETCLIRQDTSWHEWRAALSRALMQVDDLRDDENWLPLAREALRDELMPIRSKLEAVVQASPALDVLRSSRANLLIAGLGAGAGLSAGASMGPTTATVAMTAIATLGHDYVTSLRARRKKLPLLTTVVALTEAQ